MRTHNAQNWTPSPHYSAQPECSSIIPCLSRTARLSIHPRDTYWWSLTLSSCYPVLLRSYWVLLISVSEPVLFLPPMGPPTSPVSFLLLLVTSQSITPWPNEGSQAQLTGFTPCLSWCCPTYVDSPSLHLANFYFFKTKLGIISFTVSQKLIEHYVRF